MLTHWHGVPTQMLLLESTTGRARDRTPPWHRLRVALFCDSKFLFWWFAWSLTSCQIIPKVWTDLGRCQVEQLLWWKFHGNISLTNSAKFYHPWQDFQDFWPSHTFQSFEKFSDWHLKCTKLLPVVSEINIWRVLQGLFLCWRKQDGVL